VALSPKWARGWTIPATSAAMVALASLYYYRDGLNLSASAVQSTAALIAGSIPGQRFLIPVSMVACIPAARFLDAQSMKMPHWAGAWARPVALAAFTAGFAVLSIAHDSFLRAHAIVQAALCESITVNSPIAISDSVLKETAPTCHPFVNAVLTDDSAAPPADAFTAWLGAPGARAPDSWLKDRETKTFQIRSWIWNRDLSIAAPRGESSRRPRGAHESNSPA
jgi:hypothetical protein